MPRSPAPAIPDHMALLCLIGGAVRAAGSSNVLMQLLLIGTMCPKLLVALQAWISVEEIYAPTEFEYELFAEEDGLGGCDEVRRGWMSIEGPVHLWRHVTRFGQALLIPIQWYWTRPEFARDETSHGWVSTGALASVVFSAIFPTVPRDAGARSRCSV